MPLSEHEQRVLEQIERSLYAEDPKFRAAVKSSSKPAHAGSLRIALACGIIGLVVLVGGVWLQNVVVGVLGFLIMLAGGVIGIRATQHPSPKGKGEAKKRSGAGAGGSRASGMAEKAQERMRRRFEGGE